MDNLTRIYALEWNYEYTFYYGQFIFFFYIKFIHSKIHKSKYILFYYD